MERGLNFHIWIPSHPLSACFNLETVSRPDTATELLIDASSPTSSKLLEYIYDNNPLEEIVLITNAFDIISATCLKSAVPGFRNLLRPSAAVQEVIRRQYDTLKVDGPGSYVSLHVRCGDAFMKSYDRYCPGDARCTPEDAVVSVKAAILRIRESTDLPILFHTDSYELRDAIADLPLKVPTTVIQHTAQHTEGGLNDYYDAVAEFFIIGQAASVYYTVPSGFTRWSCALFDKEPICLKYVSTNKDSE